MKFSKDINEKQHMGDIYTRKGGHDPNRTVKSKRRYEWKSTGVTLIVPDIGTSKINISKSTIQQMPILAAIARYPEGERYKYIMPNDLTLFMVTTIQNRMFKVMHEEMYSADMDRCVKIEQEFRKEMLAIRGMDLFRVLPKLASADGLKPSLWKPYELALRVLALKLDQTLSINNISEYGDASKKVLEFTRAYWEAVNAKWQDHKHPAGAEPPYSIYYDDFEGAFTRYTISKRHTKTSEIN